MKRTKNHLVFQLSGLLLLLFVTASCHREADVDLSKGFSSQIQKIVPQAIIDSLRNKGLIINEGMVPPQVAGIYQASQFVLQMPYGPEDSWRPGKIIPDQYYKFYGQTTDNAITYDYRQADGNDKGNGQGSFIAGNGNKFTIFAEEVGIGSNIPYKHLTVISGELTDKGINNFQYAFVMKDKTGDSDNKVLIAVGKSRIWKDSDGLAVKTSYFPQSIKPAPAEARAMADDAEGTSKNSAQ